MSIATASPLVIQEVKKPQTQVFPPHIVALCAEGKKVQDRIAADKKRLDTLKEQIGTILDNMGVREATNASGLLIAVRTHGNPRKFDQAAFKVEHPALMEAFTRNMPWDSVSFKG